MNDKGREVYRIKFDVRGKDSVYSIYASFNYNEEQNHNQNKIEPFFIDGPYPDPIEALRTFSKRLKDVLGKMAL